jgi:hypothetical protein
MFRRIRYRKWLIAGLGLAALVAPSSALATGSSSTHNMSSQAYQALVAKGQAMNAKYGTHNLPPAAYRALLAKSEALNARYGVAAQKQQGLYVADGRAPDTIDAANAAPAVTGFDPNSPATHARLVAQGYIDGSIGAGSLPDGRSQDIRSTEEALRLSQGQPPVDGRSPDTRDAASQAHSPVVTITRSPGFQWDDFGIGTGVALGAVLMVALFLRILTNRQGRKPTPVATA